MDTGTVIRLVRIADGVPQATLAKELHVTKSYLSQVENGGGKFDLGFLRKVARRFALPMPLLLLGEAVNSPNDEVFSLLREILGRLLAARTRDMKDDDADTAADAPKDTPGDPAEGEGEFVGE
ncbi:MAG: helix-turn-helix transcriptional regulator [Phycisphaerae bacterium]|nr:helix-turn-helix transcriptional regulator [Phycisphaerae bacterium]